MTTSGTGKRPHVVVVGGGFGGLGVVHALRKADVDITLVDQHAYNTFQPLLYQVATATLNPGDVTWFLRAVRARQRNVRFVQGAAIELDPGEHRIGLDSGHELTYDYLVLACGVTANFFGIPGAAENSMPLYTRGQALDLRDRIFARLEDAAVNYPDQDLRIVVVGAGPTGVETSGALAEMRNKDLPVLYPELNPERVHVTLVEMASHPLAPFSQGSREYARKALAHRGVDLRFDTKVQEVRADGVVVGDDEEFLPAGIVVWASGVSVADHVADWGLPQGKGGRVRVDEHFRVQGRTDVFAVGDVAVGEGDHALPQLAQPAIQAGRHAGRVIAADVAGVGDVEPFSYSDKGILATIGRSAAVAEVAHMPNLTGFPAWAIWNAVHITTLLGGRNRAAAMVNLGAKYLAWGRTHNAIVGETPKAVARRMRGRQGSVG